MLGFMTRLLLVIKVSIGNKYDQSSVVELVSTTKKEETLARTGK